MSFSRWWHKPMMIHPYNGILNSGKKIHALWLYATAWMNLKCIILSAIRCTHPGWCGLVDWVPACKPKGHWFNSWSRHMPGWRARCPVGSTQETTTRWLFSPSLSSSLPLSKNKINKVKKKKKMDSKGYPLCASIYMMFWGRVVELFCILIIVVGTWLCGFSKVRCRGPLPTEPPVRHGWK